MKKIWLVLAVLAAVAVTAACNEKNIKSAAGYVSAGVQAYCATPQYGRLALRQAVTDLIEPNTIVITCALDGLDIPESAPQR